MFADDRAQQSTETSDEDRRSIELALEGVLRSGSFSASRQCQTLLRYLVDKAQAPNEHSLKERSIGVEVFGRKIDYDTANDPIARSRVGEVRKRLAQYYQSDEGQHAKFQLTLPHGSYRVIFQARSGVATPPPEEPSGANSDSMERARPSTSLATSRAAAVWAMCALFIMTAVFLLLRFAHRPEDAALRFWKPLFQSSQPVFIYTGTNLIFSPTKKLRAKLLQDPHAVGQAPGKIPYLSALTVDDVLSLDEVHPNNYEYTTIGDMAAGMRLAAFLALRQHTFELRAGENISIGDLRNYPAILIGASNNSWTLVLTQKLPISLGITLEGEAFIHDNGPTNSTWRQQLNSSATDGADYGIVARLLNPETGKPVVIVAGLTSFATRACGQFVSDPDALRVFSKTAPRDWDTMNMEIVLKTNVLKSDSGAAAVVAARFW